MIKEWLGEYKPQNKEQADQALREIMQEIALAGLQRSRFFEVAAFYGGTALRIFHGLDRFSEDLDFSLLKVDPDFSMKPYLEGMVREFDALGMKVSVAEKDKKKHSNVDSAFLKPDTSWQELTLKGIIPEERMTGAPPSIKIKLEIDKKPPLGFETEEKLLVRPFSFYTKCYVLPDLFAGKMHALLFRKWGNRVKGRDWYDMEWYIKNRIPLNLDHLAVRSQDSGNWPADTMSKEVFFKLLNDKIDSVSMDRVKEDVIPFIKDAARLDIWSAGYFKDMAKLIRFVDKMDPWEVHEKYYNKNVRVYLRNKSVLYGFIIGEIRQDMNITGWRFVNNNNAIDYQATQKEELVQKIKHSDIERIENFKG